MDNSDFINKLVSQLSLKIKDRFKNNLKDNDTVDIVYYSIPGCYEITNNRTNYLQIVDDVDDDFKDLYILAFA